MAAPFSRVQLAAALLEYDNDPDNPDAPGQRFAHESAIFAHLRRNTPNRPPVASRKSDYLGVSVPSDGGSLTGRESTLDKKRNRNSRASRSSVDALRNPFGQGDADDSEEDSAEDELEVDLASWGLDAFIPKDKESKKGKGKASLPNPHPVSSLRSRRPSANLDATNPAPRRALGARSMSVGNIDLMGVGSSSLDVQPPHSANDILARRRSIASPLDVAEMEHNFDPAQRNHTSFRGSNADTPGEIPYSVPFPTGSVRAPSPPLDGGRPNAHSRALSSASMGSRLAPVGEGGRPRAASNATMATILPAEDNPFALEPPTRASKFDPKAALHARTMSNASMNSRMILENDGVSVMTRGRGDTARERTYSTTMDLMRPKVLVMPSPLQPVGGPAVQPAVRVLDGFELTTDGAPLPPGARATRRNSMTLSTMGQPSPLIASNSFTPNPSMSLSLSQMTFRNTLMVGGQRDTAYVDEFDLPRATEDGEQIDLMPVPPEELSPVDLLTPHDPSKPRRPPGKLYGKSLIDDLESRKAQMRSKQRVFTGDDRPSMMARGPQQRQSTLIDPAGLQVRPATQRMSSYGSQGSQPVLARRNSANVKPLLNFDDERSPGLAPPGNGRMASSRSVFGVDTLWEREMSKLKEMESRDKIEAEERRKREEAEEARKERRKRKGKGKKQDADTLNVDTGTIAENRVSVEPPSLPQISPIRRQPPPPVNDDESDSGSSDDEPDPAKAAQAKSWYAGSSDEDEDGPRRTTGTGPRFPNKSRQPVDEDSEEDIPLAAAVSRVARRIRRGNDDDEHTPLSVARQQTGLSLPSINFDSLSHPAPQDEDEDDKPLGLRVSRIQNPGNADDDDRPLAFHPEQQRRTQYQMMAQQQQQQQQQQMMMQAQLQSSMFFGPPPMMGPGFFGAPMLPPVMMQHPPMSMPSPPPMHDDAKFTRVDNWRRDVAVEGEP